MSQVQIRFDAKHLANEIGDKLRVELAIKPLLRIVAFDLVAMMTDRIHNQGLDSSGSRIGTYGRAYLKVRMSKYKRTGDTKIIMSLTRQLENDWAVGETEKGWGIGFNNPYNAQKALWVEEQTGKKIVQLSSEEHEYAEKKINELLEQRR